MAGKGHRPHGGQKTYKPCRQRLCGSFIEIKGVGEGREKEKYEARTSLPVLKSSWKEPEWAELVS